MGTSSRLQLASSPKSAPEPPSEPSLEPSLDPYDQELNDFLIPIQEAVNDCIVKSRDTTEAKARLPEIWEDVSQHVNDHPKHAEAIHKWLSSVQAALLECELLTYAQYNAIGNNSQQRTIIREWGAPIDTVLAPYRPEQGFSRWTVRLVSQLSKRVGRQRGVCELAKAIEARSQIPYGKAATQGISRNSWLMPIDVTTVIDSIGKVESTSETEKADPSLPPTIMHRKRRRPVGKSKNATEPAADSLQSASPPKRLKITMDHGLVSPGSDSQSLSSIDIEIGRHHESVLPDEPSNVDFDLHHGMVFVPTWNELADNRKAWIRARSALMTMVWPALLVMEVRTLWALHCCFVLTHG